jgi:hypothetical protein
MLLLKWLKHNRRRVKMMAKGKGYPDHVKNTDKGFGDMLKAGVQGKRAMAGVLNEYDADSYVFPDPKVKTQKNSLKD